MWAKLAATILDKVTVFSKSYDVTISVYGVTNKILSRDLIHLVDLVKLPTFHNYGISVREVHNFNWIWLEKRSFRGMVLPQNLYCRNGDRYCYCLQKELKQTVGVAYCKQFYTFFYKKTFYKKMSLKTLKP